MARSDADVARNLASKWDTEAFDLERGIERPGNAYTREEKQLLQMHARIKRTCAAELRNEINRVRRG